LSEQAETAELTEFALHGKEGGMRELLIRRNVRYATAVVISAVGIALGAGAAQATVSAFTVDPKGSLSAGGTHVTLTGTITCDSGDLVYIAGGVIETVGRLQRTAIGFNNPTIITCSGASQLWSATFTANTNQALLPGPANADVLWSDVTDFTFATVATTILITPS
jgi:Family of unknown function (DUF6299)